MRPTIFCLLLFLCAPMTAAAETLRLGNDPWPPFVVEGENRGTAEQIVCEALRRAGWDCEIELGDWEETLRRAGAGELDGIAALWFSPERAESLRFSTPYLTNRLVPVTRADAGLDVRSIADLGQQRVAMEVAAAYNEDLRIATRTFDVVEVRSVADALRAVQTGQADVAIVDELIARDFIDRSGGRALAKGPVALAYRELHFAVSRRHPQEQEIIAAFNTAYQDMLRDGTVNRILDIDWIVTDLKSDGILDFVHRGGDPLTGQDAGDTVYPMGQAEYERLREPGFVGSSANYLADDVQYETPEAAMKALDSGNRCRYDSLSARIVCTGR